MKNNDFQNLVNGIQEKIGEETTSTIADDLGILITDNVQMNNELEEKDKEISKLKKEKENLISANGNLLKQVGMGEDIPNNFNNKEKEDNKKFNFKNAFDEKGNFK